MTTAEEGATRDCAVASVPFVLAVLNVTCVALSTETTVVPAGKLAFVSTMPGASPVVLVIVTTAEAAGMVAPP